MVRAYPPLVVTAAFVPPHPDAEDPAKREALIETIDRFLS